MHSNFNFLLDIIYIIDLIWSNQNYNNFQLIKNENKAPFFIIGLDKLIILINDISECEQLS